MSAKAIAKELSIIVICPCIMGFLARLSRFGLDSYEFEVRQIAEEICLFAELERVRGVLC